MRVFPIVLLLALGVGCDESGSGGPGVLTFDSGSDAASDAGIDAGIDAGADSSTDAATDSAVDSGADGGDASSDATVVPRDSQPDSKPQHELGTFLTPCNLEENRNPTCPVAGCPAGFTCQPGLCGGNTCIFGRACAEDGDCSSNSCISVSRPSDPFAAVCEPVEQCVHRRDCPLGFECETGECVARYVHCGAVQGESCPRGYACATGSAQSDTGGSLDVCERMMDPCTSDQQCTGEGRCIDVDGDGNRECAPFDVIIECESSEDADSCQRAGEGCGIEPQLLKLACTVNRFCKESADCNAEQICLDAAGVGQGVCVAAGGTCTSNTECDSPSICAAMSGLGPASCIGDTQADRGPDDG